MNEELRYLSNPTKDELINNWKEYALYLEEELTLK